MTTDMANDHFFEAFAAELPSESMCFSVLQSASPDPCNRTSETTPYYSQCRENGINLNDVASSRESAAMYRMAMATEHHSVEISIDVNEGNMNVTALRLPRVGIDTNMNDINKCNFHRQCTAHSFLRMESKENTRLQSNFYLEAFAIVEDTLPQHNNMEAMDNTQHSYESGHDRQSDTPSLIKGTSSRSLTDTITQSKQTQSTNSLQQSASVADGKSGVAGSEAAYCTSAGDSKKDEIAFQNKASSEQKGSSYILLREIWPSTIEDCPKEENGMNNDGGGIESTTPPESKITTRRKNKNKSKKKKAHKSSNNESIHNQHVMTNVEISSPPLLIKLCTIALIDRSTKEQEASIVAGLFVASPDDDTNLNFFTISGNAINSPPVKQPSSWVSGNLRVEKTALEIRTSLSPLKWSGAGRGDTLTTSLWHDPIEESNSSEQCNPLDFHSPVMAMHTLVLQGSNVLAPSGEDAVNCIAVGCQDGTVRIILYTASKSNTESSCRNSHQFQDDEEESDMLSLDILHVSQFVVDGPIISLALTEGYFGMRGKSTRVSLVVGSLCGFACLFRQSYNKTSKLEFGGPYMITEVLWCKQIEVEDSVLAVCEFQYGGVKCGRVVAVGTYSGRLLLVAVQEDETSCSCKLIWSCRLPHPIHGIVVSGFGLIEMLIITRKTIHLFKGNANKFAEAAKFRMEQLTVEKKTM